MRACSGTTCARGEGASTRAPGGRWRQPGAGWCDKNGQQNHHLSPPGPFRLIPLTIAETGLIPRAVGAWGRPRCWRLAPPRSPVAAHRPAPGDSTDDSVWGDVQPAAPNKFGPRPAASDPNLAMWLPRGERHADHDPVSQASRVVSPAHLVHVFGHLHGTAFCNRRRTACDSRWASRESLREPDDGDKGEMSG